MDRYDNRIDAFLVACALLGGCDPELASEDAELGLDEASEEHERADAADVEMDDLHIDPRVTGYWDGLFDLPIHLVSQGIVKLAIDGYAVQPYAWTGNPANPYQGWWHSLNEMGFLLRNEVSGECLDGYPGPQNNVVHPYMWACNPYNPYQTWNWAGPCKKSFLYQNLATGLCLEVGQLGQQVSQKPCDSANLNQCFWSG